MEKTPKLSEIIGIDHFRITFNQKQDCITLYYHQNKEAAIEQAKIFEKQNLKEKSLFELWDDELITGLGSFNTELFKAFRLADTGNQERLKKAFPHWFTTDHKQGKEDWEEQ